MFKTLKLSLNSNNKANLYFTKNFKSQYLIKYINVYYLLYIKFCKKQKMKDWIGFYFNDANSRNNNSSNNWHVKKILSIVKPNIIKIMSKKIYI